MFCDQRGEGRYNARSSLALFHIATVQIGGKEKSARAFTNVLAAAAVAPDTASSALSYFLRAHWFY